jgi:hypothetical protein
MHPVDPNQPFRYQPLCSDRQCSRPAVYKLAATWSDSSSSELKNYGLTCEIHRESLLDAARRRHEGLKLADDETVGPVELYVLQRGCRDTELRRYEKSGEQTEG